MEGLVWDAKGLIPAVAQDATTGAVLMVAWMNAEALEATLTTREAHFFSRSRGRLWKKGETSGHVLSVRELRVDCDGDTLLLLVDPRGPACHTGKPTCFFRTLPEHAEHAEDDGHRGAPAAVVDRVARVIQARKSASAEKSYTKSLLEAGMPKVLAKIAEEQGELAAELPAGHDAAVVHETADLLFHVLVGLSLRDIPVLRVWAELERRFGQSGHDEKASRPPKTS
jgi:phosphoribosyl-ATP pyrophosphohydrolase/phosphoribosyl-AMP cyclohydrolase